MFPITDYLVIAPRLFLKWLKTSTGPFLKKVELPPSVEIWGGTPVEVFLKPTKTTPPLVLKFLNTSTKVPPSVEIRGGTLVEASLE